MTPAGRPRGAGSTRPNGRILRLGVAVVLGIAIGVTLDVLRVGGLDAWLGARGPMPDTMPPPYRALGRPIEVEGRSVYLDCRGAGSPTVILEAGFGSGAGGWGVVLDGIAGFTRVCAWDRPGLGRSDARGLHTAADTAADLRAALGAAGERRPFVIVAHSLGGVYARIFAEGPAAQGDVLAYLMLDTYDPDIGMVDDPTIPAASRDVIRRSLADTGAMIQTGEQLDWARTLAELAVAGPADLPTIRITADVTGRWVDPDPAVVEALISSLRRGVARVYPGAREVLAERSGHLIPYDRPDLVIATARELVEQARAGTLPGG